MALPHGVVHLGAAPMTYMLDGRQHVLITAGNTLVSFALPKD